MSNSNELLKISIIIVNYNGLKFLEPCISSVFDLNYPKSHYEIIVADNASSDGSVEFLKGKYPEIKVLKLKADYGFAGGNNRTYPYIKYDYIAVLSNDTTVEKNWLIELVKTIQLNDRIGISGSKSISYDKKTVQYDGYLLHPLGGVIPGKIPHKLGNNKLYLVGSVYGAAFLIKKSVFKELNGFDDIYFLYSEEVDLSYRTWALGYYIVYNQDSIIYHFGGGAPDNFNDNQTSLLKKRLNSAYRIYYGNRNSIMNILKSYNIQNVISGLIGSIPLFAIQGFFLLKEKKVSLFFKLISSMIWPVKHFGIIWGKRVFIQKSRKKSDNELIKLKIFVTVKELMKSIITK